MKWGKVSNQGKRRGVRHNLTRSVWGLILLRLSSVCTLQITTGSSLKNKTSRKTTWWQNKNGPPRCLVFSKMFSHFHFLLFLSLHFLSGFGVDEPGRVPELRLGSGITKWWDFLGWSIFFYLPGDVEGKWGWALVATLEEPLFIGCRARSGSGTGRRIGKE